MVAARTNRRVRKLFEVHETDPGFRQVILRHNIAGMRLSGILAIGVVVVFLIGSALEGKEIILIPGHAYSGDQVALVDKLAIALMGGALLIASVFKKGLIHGRLIVAVGLVATVFAMVADDAARRDPSFAPIEAGATKGTSGECAGLQYQTQRTRSV